MKLQNIFSGLTCIALGAALLAAGPLVDEQFDVMAANPKVQMAQALYASTLRAMTARKNSLEVHAATGTMKRVYVVQRPSKACSATQM